MSLVISALENVIDKIWKAFDDCWFLEKGSDTFEESIEKSGKCFQEACARLNSWLAELNNNIVHSLDDKIRQIDVYQELMCYRSYGQSLQEFYINFSRLRN